jgi:hypothetical protein
MFYAICYVSTANELDQFQVQKLLSTTESKNNKQNISGILIHNSGNFLQYIEGSEENVKSLYYEKICKDTRHKNSIVLIEKSINNLYFNGYETGFTTILEENTTHKLRTYLNLLKYLDSQEVEAVTRTIETFLGKSSNK